MSIKKKGGYILIKTHDGFYDVALSQIKSTGQKDDRPGTLTLWGWINHLRDKTWWSASLENEFIRLVLN